jgi:hypothetical protein
VDVKRNKAGVVDWIKVVQFQTQEREIEQKKKHVLTKEPQFN